MSGGQLVRGLVHTLSRNSRKLGRLIIDETPAYGRVQGLDSPKHSAAAPRSQRTCDLERLAEPHWNESAVPLAPKNVSVPEFSSRSAALKAIVRTEQNNFAGGGAVAG